MTLPADLYELETLEAVLIGRGDEVADLYQCPACVRQLPAIGIVRTAGLPGDLPAFVCHTCASAPHRAALAAQSESARVTDAAAGVYDWSDARADRDLKLARSDWTQMPDSPLDEPARAVWAAYRQALRDVTETPGGPASIVWPSVPS